MILINFIICIFVLFLSPQIFLKGRFDLKYTHILINSFIISFSFIWVIFLFNYYLKIPNNYIQIIFYGLFITTLYDIYRNSKYDYLLFIVKNYLFSLILLFPLLKYFGDVFLDWDAIVSWNRWAIEIYENTYHSEGTAYPVLISSMWGLIYKVQGSSEIWWTAKFSMIIIPLTVVVYLFGLYKETRNKSYIFIFICSYFYLINKNVISGFVDFPIFLFGIILITMLYYVETIKGKYNIDNILISGIFLAGLSSIVKQSGIIFIVFMFLYLILNLKFITNIKKIFLFFLISLFFIISFLIVFFANADNPTANLDYLRSIISEDFFTKIKKFFSYPKIDYFLIPIFILLTLYSFYKSFLNEYFKFKIMIIIFFIIGTVIWYHNFSYDGRNALWAKSFLVVYVGIFLAYLQKTEFRKNKSIKRLMCLFAKYIRFSTKKVIMNKYKYFMIGMFISILLYKGTAIAYFFQENSQKNIGKEEIAKEIVTLLKNKKDCVKIVTNRLPLYYNYYLKEYKNRVIANAWYVDGFLAYLKHDCIDGRYFIFGEWTTKIEDKTNWHIIEELQKNEQIKLVNKDKLIFFIPHDIKGKNYE